MKYKKIVLKNLFSGQRQRHRHREWTCGHKGERGEWSKLSSIDIYTLLLLLLLLLLSHISCVRPCVTPQMAAHQAPIPRILQARILEWIAFSDIYTSMCEIGRQLEAAEQHRAFNWVICDDLEEWDGGGRRLNREEIYIYTHIAGSLYFTIETNTTL